MSTSTPAAPISVRTRLFRWWRVAGTGSSFALFGLGGLAVAAVIHGFRLWPVRGSSKEDRSQRIVHRLYGLFVGYMRAIRVLDVQVIGAERLRTPGGHLIVANHDLLLRWPPDYPSFKHAIVDEAHELADVADEVYAVSVRPDDVLDRLEADHGIEAAVPHGYLPRVRTHARADSSKAPGVELERRHSTSGSLHQQGAVSRSCGEIENVQSLEQLGGEQVTMDVFVREFRAIAIRHEAFCFAFTILCARSAGIR